MYKLEIKKIIITAAVFILFTALFTVGFSTPLPCAELTEENGIVSLEGVDFDGGIAELPTDCDWYGGKLYEPSDFEDGAPEEPGRYGGTPGAESMPCGTYRMILKGEPFRSYLLTGRSVDYAMRLWCGSETVVRVGRVSPSPEGFVPCVGYFKAPVRADQDGVIAFTLQYANFVHNEGGGLNAFYIGSGENITFFNNREDAAQIVICGGFSVLALYFLLHVFTEGRRDHIVMAVCCLLAALRSQRFYLSFLVGPEYDWYVHYRIIVMNTIWMQFAFLLLLHMVSDKAKKRWIVIAATAVTAVSSILICLMPTRMTAAISVAAAFLIMLLFAVKIVMMAVENIRSGGFSTGDTLIFIGVVVILIAGLVDYNLIRSVPFFTRSGVVSTAFLAFVFLTKAVSDISVAEMRQALIKEQENSRFLERQNSFKNELLSNVSHEIRTPLTVISGYSQTIMRRLDKSGVKPDQRTFDELTFIQKEASRLSDLADQLTQTGMWKSVGSSLEPLDLGECFKGIQRVADPILVARDSRLEIRSAPGLPPIVGSADLVSQIFYNLITNSSRHTSDDVITLDVYPDGDDTVTMVFTDHGDGMTREQLERVFDTGYSRDGSHGRGLPLCREIVTHMGGEISIESEKGKGTSVTIRVPVWKEDTEENEKPAPD